MKSRICTTKANFDKELETIQHLFGSYFSTQNNNITDVFFAFLTDKLFEIQDFLYKTNYKEVFINANGLFFKKSDIFRSVCIDKIVNTILQQYEGEIYIELEKNIYLGKKNYHKPDITIYKGYNEETFDNYYDVYLVNPEPTILIEFVDFNDELYVRNIISVYKNADVLKHNNVVLFVDLVKKDLYKFTNYMGIDPAKISTYNDDDLSYININNYLQKMDYRNDLHFDDLVINFETMLTNKK
ncbi:hypothetical protein BDAP_002891 [Binucleata daphniae]